MGTLSLEAAESICLPDCKIRLCAASRAPSWEERILRLHWMVHAVVHIQHFINKHNVKYKLYGPWYYFLGQCTLKLITLSLRHLRRVESVPTDRPGSIHGIAPGTAAGDWLFTGCCRIGGALSAVRVQCARSATIWALGRSRSP